MEKKSWAEYNKDAAVSEESEEGTRQNKGLSLLFMCIIIAISVENAEFNVIQAI